MSSNLLVCGCLNDIDSNGIVFGVLFLDGNAYSTNKPLGKYCCVRRIFVHRNLPTPTKCVCLCWEENRA